MRHLVEPGQRARRIADGIDNGMGSEAAAILAQPSTFGFELAFARRNFQGAGRQRDGAIFLENARLLLDESPEHGRGWPSGCRPRPSNPSTFVVLEKKRPGGR